MKLRKRGSMGQVLAIPCFHFGSFCLPRGFGKDIEAGEKRIVRKGDNMKGCIGKGMIGYTPCEGRGERYRDRRDDEMKRGER